MSARREEWNSYGNEEWDQQNKKRSFVWPFVATCMAALAIKNIMSLRRRVQIYEKFAEAYSKKSGPSSSNGDRSANARAAGTGNSSDSERARTFRFTYWTSDGFRTVKREGYAHRDSPWASFFRDFFDREELERLERVKREGYAHRDSPWASFFRDFFDREELERLERMRRMAEAFQRERVHYTRSYQKWQEGGEETSDQGGRHDWSWTKTDWDAWKKAEHGRFQTSQHWKSPYGHHYKVLGLDVSRAGTYSQAEIKAAYRTKAMEYHPDRNQHKKDFAEAKFRDVVTAYEALKK